MKKSVRLVLVDTQKNTYSVYDNKVMLAHYALEGKELLPKEEIEQLRTATYDSKA